MINNMKQIILLLITVHAMVISAYSQTTVNEIERQTTVDSVNSTDSAKWAALDRAAIAYPVLRQAYFSTEVLGNGTTTATLLGNPLYKGNVSVTREKAGFNFPISKWGKNSLSGSFSYVNQHYNIDQVQDFNGHFPVSNMNFNATTVGLAITWSRKDSLFHTPVIYSSTIAVFRDNSPGIKRVNYVGTIIFPLVRTASNAFSVGLAIIADPTSSIPVIPVLSYWHRFGQTHTELFVDIPSRIALRTQLTKNSWISFGTRLTTNLAFFSLNQPALGKDASYTSIDLKTGPSYEHRIGKKLMFGVSGGYLSTFDSRLFKGYDSWNSALIKNNNNAVPYINFTLSFLPFLRSTR